MYSVKKLVIKLGLQPHPEGGFFKETYRSKDQVIAPKRFKGNNNQRSASTIINFLMQSDDFSAFHRLLADETWTFVQGSPVLLHLISPKTKQLTTIKIGSYSDDALPIFTVPYGTWFAAETEKNNSYSLVSCHVSPGFEFTDFELAEQNTLVSKFPEHEKTIKKLIRATPSQKKIIENITENVTNTKFAFL